VQHDYGYNDDSSGYYALPTSITSHTGLSPGPYGSTPPTGTGTSFKASINYDYNLAKPISTADINGNLTSYSYANEGMGRLTTIARPDSGTTTFNYNDTPGQISVQTTADQNSPNDHQIQSDIFFDGLGRQWESAQLSGAENVVVCATYDNRSRLASKSNPTISAMAFGTGDSNVCNDGATSYTYDGISRQRTVTAPDGSVTQHLYQPDATYHTDQTLEIEPGAAGQQVNRLLSKDAAGRLIWVEENVKSWQGGTYGFADQPTYSTTYSYDALDDLTGVSQSGESRSFVYDSLRRLVQASNSENGTINYAYDDSNNLSTKTDARSLVTCFGTWSASGCGNVGGYDGLNRLLIKTYSDGTTPPVVYQYDGSLPGCNLEGHLTSVTAGSAINNYLCYDWAGKSLTNNQVTAGVTYSMSHVYNLAGNLTMFTFPSGRQQMTSYDNSGHEIGLTGTYQSVLTTYASAFNYFPNGALGNVTIGRELVQQYCQNNRLQVVGIRLSPPGGSVTPNCSNSNPGTLSGGDILNLSFGYGSSGANNGNLIAQTIASNDPLSVTQSYTYDAVNRLSVAVEGTAWSLAYSYDAYGNGWLSASSGLPLSPFTPTSSTNYNQNGNFNNQVSVDGAAYDGSGNQQSIGGYSYTYDAESRLTSSTLGGVSTQYTYDGQGRRVVKTTGASSTVYVYDAKGDCVAEYNNQPEPVVGTVYLTQDYLGSTRLVTDTDGNILKRYDYLPFGGEILNGTDGRGNSYNTSLVSGPVSDTVNNKFTGKERDAESGLDYFGARYFSAAQGRFTSPDPMLNSGRPWLPQSWNRYAYSLNNPLRFVDPNGLWEWDAKCKKGDAACEGNRQKFRDAVQQLRNALGKTEKGSDAYNALNKALGKIGTEGDKNNVLVAFSSKQSDPGDTRPTLGGNIRMTFNFSLIDNPLSTAGYKAGDSAFGISEAGLVAHEGTHAAEGLAHGLMWVLSPQERANFEGRGNNAESLFYETVNNDPYGVLWNPSWIGPDRDKVEQKRREAVVNSTEQQYGKKPKIY
jgi:RHS repeat-associated protein